VTNQRKPPDWTRTGTVAGYAEYLRKQADALCVVVIRRDDAVFAVDPACAPGDARALVEERLPDLECDVNTARMEKRSAARSVMEPVRE
jgi:hypothetical protein